MANALLLCLASFAQLPFPFAQDGTEPLPVQITVRHVYAEGFTLIILRPRAQEHEPLIAAVQLAVNNLPVVFAGSMQGAWTQEVHLLIRRHVTPAIMQEYEQDLRRLLPEIQAFVWDGRSRDEPLASYTTGKAVRLSRDPERGISTTQLLGECLDWLSDHGGMPVTILHIMENDELHDILILTPVELDPTHEERLRKNRARPNPGRLGDRAA